MPTEPQTFANHKRVLRPWHLFAFPVLSINVFVAAYRMSQQDFSTGSIWDFLVAIALIVAIFLSRVMPLTVQNRVIRMEERLRMQEKLPAELRSGISGLSPGQFVGLRFASDEELPELARRCMNGDLKTATDVKKAIGTWRPDTLRV